MSATVLGAEGYNVYYDQAGKSQLLADVGNTTTFTDVELVNGNVYCYKVTAVEGACESAFSNIQCATTLPKPPPVIMPTEFSPAATQ